MNLNELDKMRHCWPKEPEDEDSLTTTIVMSIAGVVILALTFLAGWMALPGAVEDLQARSHMVVQESRR